MVGMYTDQYSSRLGRATRVTQSLSVCMLEHNIKATECFHCHLSGNPHFVSMTKTHKNFCKEVVSTAN